MNQLVQNARDFAKIQHGDTLDDNGKNYFKSHVCQVVKILEQVTNDPYILAAAYLHDTIEDCEQSYDSLSFLFGKTVAGLVMEVTHDGNRQDGYTFPRLFSKDAILIKFADRLSNLSRMESWDTDRQLHYLKRSKFWKG